VLDEPTNHLDMRSKDILKSALLQFDGTLIIVSHDRDFLSGLTEKVIEFRHKGIKEYLGDVHDFLDSRKLEHLNELEKKSGKQNPDLPEDSPSQNKLDFERRKQFERELRKLQNKVEKSETAIMQMENEIAALDKLLANPDPTHPLIKSGEVYHRYETLKNDLAGEMKIWETMVHELDTFEKVRY
jgi:ATP-binding cassette subfamily F protein 3